MSQRVTLEDIARQSGVSLATVSLALRNKPGINDETRQRVLNVARTLGYRKRSQGDAVRSQSLHRVGLLNKVRVDDRPKTNHFYAPVVAGIEESCRRQQINLLYATVQVDADNHPLELPRMLLENDLDGMLLVGAFVDSTIERLMQRRATPMVLVDGYASENAYDSVVSDNFRGAYEAVSYLIARGHRHIGLIGSLPNAYPSIEERRRGYLLALHDHAIGAPYFADSHISIQEATAATTALLHTSPQITALFCCNDEMAITAMQVAQELGRRLPDDLSIIGFDNIDLAEHVTPGLTTMHVDKISMGRLAVQLLANRVEHPSASCVTAVLQPTLIERESVSAISATVASVSTASTLASTLALR
jgi:LacI family transcriptional regulator